MKGIIHTLAAGFLVLVAGASIAATSTTTKTETSTTKSSSMNNNWTCTTNASSSDVPADKAADDKMENAKGSAKDSFAFAAQHCRDCTKITCELDND